MNMNDRKEPTFQSVEDVLALAREATELNYLKNLELMNKAKTDDERMEALRAVDHSIKMSRELSLAEEQLINSRENAKAGTGSFLKGDELKAKQSFDLSGKQMNKAADNLETFTAYIPQSKSFAFAMDMVAKKDEIKAKLAPSIDGAMAGIELKAARTVQTFAAGLKSFASSMRDFGLAIANTPEKIKAVAKEKAISTIEATTTVATGMMSKALRFFNSTKDGAINKIDSALEASIAFERKVVSKIDNSIEKVEQKIDSGMTALRAHRDSTVEGIKNKAEQAHDLTIRGRDAAWDTIDRLGQASVKKANEIKTTVVDTADTIDRHAQAVVTLSGRAVVQSGQVAAGLLKSLGASYNEALVEVDQTKKKRSQP